MPTAAKTTSTVALAEAARRQQVAIRNAAVADIARLWRLLDFDKLDKTWQAWLQPVADILTRRHQMSADAAALFYRAARQHATGDPGTLDLAKLADPPTSEWVARAIGYAAPGTYSRQVDAKVAPEQANKAALVQTLGTTSRIVLDGGRTTIEQSAKADPAAIGWYFKTDGDPCHLCAIIAARGVIDQHGHSIFHEHSFDATDRRWTGKGTAKVHNGCACSLAPAFSKDQELPALNREALQVYKDRGSGPSFNAFRRAWEDRKRPEGHKPRTPRVPEAPKITRRNVDDQRTTAELQATLADLERSALKFSSPATKARIEELRRKIAAR